MAESPHEGTQPVSEQLFDKYLLPKAALTVILIASFVGTAISVHISHGWNVQLALSKWGYFVALGTMTGGLFWKHGFIRPESIDSRTSDYHQQMFDRFRYVSVGAVAILVVTTPIVVVSYPVAMRTNSWSLLVIGAIIVLVLLTAISVRNPHPPIEEVRSHRGLIKCMLALIAVLGTARIEVLLETRSLIAVGVRMLHLVAFSVWIGGAIWNIFIAVPSGQNEAIPPVIQSAGRQLDRFRWAVRLIIPTLLLTGIAQSIAIFGLRVTPYFTSPVGLAILAKLGFIGVLIGIFITCPMWRACSPIDGVCDLDAIQGDHSTTTQQGGGAND